MMFKPDFEKLIKKECDLQIEIKYDGTWWHKGGRITRDKLVKLFNTILHYDPKNDEYWMVTPGQYGEVGRIKVADVPYIITDFNYDGNVLTVKTNLDQEVVVGDDHPLNVQTDKISGEPLPYVDIKNGLKARFNQATYYKLAEIAQQQGNNLVIQSSGKFYSIGSLDA